MSNILVTGGAGFIGSNFVRMVLSEHPDCQVVNLDKLTYAGNLESLADVLDNSRHGSCTGTSATGRSWRRSQRLPDRRHHQLCRRESRGSLDRRTQDLHRDQCHGTLTLLQAARDKNIERFIQVSTDEVYGSLGPQGKFTEQSPLRPNSPYSASKAAADLLVGAFGHTWGLRYNINPLLQQLRPYQFPRSSSLS